MREMIHSTATGVSADVKPAVKKSTSVPTKYQSVVESTVASEFLVDRNLMLEKAFNHTDVVIVGSGLAGLSTAYELANLQGINITMLEKNHWLGGSHWQGSTISPSIIVRKPKSKQENPANKMLDALGVPYADKDNYIIIKNSALLISSLMSHILKSNNVSVLTNYQADDILLDNFSQSVTGITTRKIGDSRSAASYPLYSKCVVSACGKREDQSLTMKRASLLGFQDMYFNNFFNTSPMNMNSSDDEMVYHTREFSPSLVVAGNEVSRIDGLPCTGMSVTGVLESGIKAARIAFELLQKVLTYNSLMRLLICLFLIIERSICQNSKSWIRSCWPFPRYSYCYYY